MTRPITTHGLRYRANTARGRANQEAAFVAARRSAAGSGCSHARKHGWVVVNADGSKLCEPTSHEEALKLRGATGGRLEER